MNFVLILRSWTQAYRLRRAVIRPVLYGGYNRAPFSRMGAEVIYSRCLAIAYKKEKDPYKTIIPAFQQEPEAYYALSAFPGGENAWIFRKSKALSAIYLDTEHFTNKDFSPFAQLVGDTWPVLPVEIDPPMHGKYRAMINPLFAPKKMQAMDEQVRQFARDYIAKFKDKGECEFMGEFAFRFPIAVFMELMGLPLDRVEEFLEWEMMLLHAPNLEVMRQGVLNVKAYLTGVIEERRRNPKDDFISYGIAAKIDGRHLTQDELFGFCFNLYVGGLDTVSTNMGLHFRHLAENPEHQALLRANPGMIPVAIEELLRAYAAVTTFRTCIKEVSVNGVQVLPGDKVAMATFLANTDPDAFDHPGEVRFDREPRHITFGTGIHRCVGAPLARREMVIAMEEFLKQIPTFTIKPGITIKTALAAMIQPMELPLSWQR
jgi:cytochrome P450